MPMYMIAIKMVALKTKENIRRRDLVLRWPRFIHRFFQVERIGRSALGFGIKLRRGRSCHPQHGDRSPCRRCW
jgi:hypothetical protein